MSTLPDRARRRLRGKTGLSISEMLVAALLLGILSLGVVYGIAFAGRQYREAMIRSEGRILSSTLSEIVANELRNTPQIRLKADGETLDCFFSRGYAVEEASMSRFYGVKLNNKLEYVSWGENDYGQLLLGNEDNEGKLVGNLLVSGAAYSKYNLKAKVSVTYSDEIFHATVFVLSPDGSVTENSFDAIPLNNLQIETAS